MLGASDNVESGGPVSRNRAMRSMATDSSISHVSDTALWVASIRAQEGQRTNPAFNDPMAAMLSGERGRAIARAMPRAALVEWGVIIRTSAIDRLINEALAAGVDTVLNLGAGLDCRPYPLAPSLRQIFDRQFTLEERQFFEKAVRPNIESGNNVTVERTVYLQARKPVA